MTTAASYSAQDAGALAALAALANTSFSSGPPILPQGWSLLATPQSGQIPGLQAILASGALPSAPQKAVGVLAVGMQWLSLLNWYDITEHQLNPLSAYLVTAPKPSSQKERETLADTAAGTTGQFDFGYQSLYGALRDAVWKKIAFVKDLDLFVVGHGQAAPLAQLAALDLRPAKPNTTSPVRSVTAYTFSTPAMGDQDFQGFFRQQIPAGYAGLAQGTTGTLIDFFPTPAASGGWVQPGQVQQVTASLPAWDDPWYERSSELYEAALGTSTAGRTAAATRQVALTGTGAAGGYNPDLAYTLAQLSAMAYQAYQHPDLALPALANWSLVGNVQTGANVTMASIFKSPTQVAVAFRGTVSWEELFTIQGNYFLTPVSYLPKNSGQFSTGISQLYTSLRDNLFAALQNIPGLPSLSLLLTGHSLGGALATLCAVDLSAPPAAIPSPAALYTFGAPPVGEYTFQSYFANSALAAVSFRVARPYDVMPSASFQATLAQAPESPQLLQGTTPYDGITFHPISGYIELLTP